MILPGKQQNGAVASIADFRDTEGMMATSKVMVCALVACLGCEEAGAGSQQAQSTKEGGKCESAQDCAKGLTCADDKTCQKLEVVEARAKCAASEDCKGSGKCSWASGSCVPGTDEDCKQSAGSKKTGA